MSMPCAVSLDLAKYDAEESRRWAEELAWEQFRESHDPVAHMSGGEAKTWVRAVFELVDVCHDDDTELGRQIRRLAETQYRTDFERGRMWEGDSERP